MVGPSGSKAAHVTCIYLELGGPHKFDMQSLGGLAEAYVWRGINGVLMSFLDVLRSLTEQVAEGVRLIIEGVSTLVDNRADDWVSLR